ncbi:MAG: helix-turn-helix transcriptional regulator [Deltaproteobacteria bacterium]|nr:helix-turn-helix transcriptional regulator [Deltaproteobacteria bacterium]
MKESKYPKLVGEFIKQKREDLGLSQKELGQLFDPPVTTQFISNVERGVTPLPPSHVTFLTKALNVAEEEVMTLLEKEYAVKLSSRLGKVNAANKCPSLLISDPVEFELMKKLYEFFSKANPKDKAFITDSIKKIIGHNNAANNVANNAGGAAS